MADLPQVAGAATLSEQLYAVLEQAIIEGTLRPGQRLHADDLAQHFGVSRIPLRETLRALDANGWIEIRPRHGAYVRERSLSELMELFEVRAMLEVQSVKLAAERRTDEQLAELRRLVAEGHQAVAEDDARRVGEVNAEFHQLVARCARNQVLADILRSLSQRVRWYFSTVGVERTKHSMEEHERIVDALERRDADAAAALVRAHIEATRAAVQDAVARELATADPPPPSEGVSTS